MHVSAVVSTTGLFIVDGGHFATDPCKRDDVEDDDRTSCHVAQQMRVLRRLFAALHDAGYANDLDFAMRLTETAELLSGWAEGTAGFPDWYDTGRKPEASTMGKVRRAIARMNGALSVTFPGDSFPVVAVAEQLCAAGISGLMGSYTQAGLEIQLRRLITDFLAPSS